MDSRVLSGALWDGEGQESLACCSPWGCKESDMTEWLNNKSSLKAVSFMDSYLTIDHFWRTESGCPTPLSCSWYFALLFLHCLLYFLPHLYRFSEICLFPFQNMLFNICGSWKNWPSCSWTFLPSALNMGDLGLLWPIDYVDKTLSQFLGPEVRSVTISTSCLLSNLVSGPSRHGVRKPRGTWRAHM